MRSGLFLKLLGLTLVIGLLFDALILAVYYSHRRDQLVGEMAAEVATLATRLARPMARAAGESPAQASDLLGVFAGLPYVVCVDFQADDGMASASWPQIGCERMPSGHDLAVPAPAAGADASYTIRLDGRALAEILQREFAVLSALAVAISLAILLAAGLVSHRIINRPLGRLVGAMTRFEVDNEPEKVDWTAKDEIGEVVHRYNAMLDREVARVAELRESYQRLEEARDEAHRARLNAEQAFADLRKAQDRLVQTEKMASLGQLTAGIAHEIKNPLNFVNNFAGVSRELLDELKEAIGSAVASLSPADRDGAHDLIATLDMNLAKVSEHGARADRIIRNMLLHSRQGSGERGRIGLNSLVEESLNLAYHGARAEDRTFQIRLEKALDPEAGEIVGYPQELLRVLVNLYSNGFYAAREREMDAGPGFEPTLTVTTIGRADKVEIRVRDNGMGIPEEVRKKLFTPFFTTKPPGQGTGLGLSLSHDIVVKQHGGTLSVESEVGRFTEFTIAVPRSAPEEQAAGAAGAGQSMAIEASCGTSSWSTTNTTR